MSGPTQSLAFAFGIGAVTAAIAGRLRIPAVLPLLCAGMLFGRSGPEGWQLVDIDSVGAIFRSFVALSIGLLVFEGGLHLDRKELSQAPRAVVGLLTIGALATLALTALVAQRMLLLPPQGYLEMLGLMAGAAVVLSDSGGLQEESTALGVPCLTLRENTERPITVEQGTNTMVGRDRTAILAGVDDILAGRGKRGRVPEYWDGQAAQRIAADLWQWLSALPRSV